MRRHARHLDRLHGDRAYVLLLVLVLLALAGAALAGVGRRVTRQSLNALRAGEELQACWGTLSCRRVLLPQAERALRFAEADREAQGPEPIRGTERTLLLAGTPFRLAFADEGAKLSVNTLHERRGRSGAETVARRLAREAGIGAPVVLRPTPPLRIGGAPVRESDARTRRDGRHSGGSGGAVDEVPMPASPYSALDQVFILGGDPAGLARDTRRSSFGSTAAFDVPLTCWGDGRLSLRRAPRKDLEEVLADVLGGGQVAQLAALRRQYPGLGVGALADELGLDERERQQLEARLTDRGSAYSLWVTVGEGTTSTSSLFVSERVGSGSTRVRSFEW